MKLTEHVNFFAEIGIDCLLKLYNAFTKNGNEYDIQNNKLKLVMLLKLNRRKLVNQYQKNRETERKDLYDVILKKIDVALESNNDTAIRCAFDCIKNIYGEDSQAIDTDSTPTEQEYLDELQ